VVPLNPCPVRRTVRPCDLFSNATAEVWFYLRSTKKLSRAAIGEMGSSLRPGLAEETNDLEALMICPPYADTEIPWAKCC
jgi:hypothetical protein